MMRTEAVDAALVDLHMPGMDGLQTCVALLAEAHASGRGQGLRVWLMTTSGSAAAERRAKEIGAMGLWRKPFNHEDF